MTASRGAQGFVRFLLDVRAASRSLHTALTDLGHDVLPAQDLLLLILHWGQMNLWVS